MWPLCSMIGARPCQMDYFVRNGFIIFAVLQGAARSHECSVDTARSALHNRTSQYENATANLKDEKRFKQLCLTQIQMDSTEMKYDDALKLCTSSEVDIIQQNWVRLNANITLLCEQDCPYMLELPNCKNMTYLDELEFSRYERFCETFRSSYKCATSALVGCKFGPTLYANIVESKVMLYWKYICNSGCSNIDETVGVITKCLDPLKKVEMSEICMAHYTFKECLKQAKNVCREVLKLVRFIYRKYDVVDRHCMTTTTVLTTSLPVTTESIEVKQQSTGESTTTTVITSTTEYDKATTEDADNMIEDINILAIEDCLSDQDLEVITAAKIDVDGVLVFLKLESCLNNITQNISTLNTILETFPEEIQQFHARLRSEAFLVARQMLLDSSKCQGQQEEITDGCSGHEYGLIPCNAGTMTMYSIMVLIASLFLLKIVVTTV